MHYIYKVSDVWRGMTSGNEPLTPRVVENKVTLFVKKKTICILLSEWSVAAAVVTRVRVSAPCLPVRGVSTAAGCVEVHEGKCF